MSVCGQISSQPCTRGGHEVDVCSQEVRSCLRRSRAELLYISEQSGDSGHITIVISRRPSTGSTAYAVRQIAGPRKLATDHSGQ